MRSLRIAFGLMTTLPFKLPANWSEGDSGRAAVWYPLVGLVIGALAWLAWTGSMYLFPPPVAAVLTLVVWVLLTGGLHLDGLADCCDGLLASTSIERRLEIMKDPHVGAFGSVGLFLVLSLKAVSLGALAPAFSPVIPLATTLARWCILPAGLAPLARPSGLGADFALGFRRTFLLWGAILPLGITLLLGLRGVAPAITGLTAAGLVVWLAKRRIGGVTGDVFGMIVEIVETVVLIAFLVDV